MQAEVIAFGDELTSGSRLDTNSQWLSQQLELVGIPVRYHTAVGDELTAARSVLQTAIHRARVIVTTGGLGPTADDLTRLALAEATGRPLVRNEEALQHIRALFARRRRVMPAHNEVQADFPQGSLMLPNPHGTAPGIQMAVERADGRLVQLFLLPGVPAEMREMWAQSVTPRLVAWLGPDRHHIRQRVIHCFGAGESEVESMLPDLIRRGRQPRVGITASQATISLRITAESESPTSCQQLLDQAEATICQSLGDLVFGRDGEELPDVVVRLLAHRASSLAVVECGTGGLVSCWLAHAARDHRCFRGGWVLGGNAGLGPGGTPASPATSRHDTVRAGELLALADSARQHFASDYALAVGPFPPIPRGHPTASLEPASARDTGDDQVRIVLVGPEHTLEHTLPFGGHPAILQPRYAKEALNLVRLQLLARSHARP